MPLKGGFGSAVLELAHDLNINLDAPIKRFGVRDEFIAHASQAEQHAENGYDPESILQFIAESFGTRKIAAAG